MAATQAFLSSRASQANLSASAAAAALRAMSPPPTQVADVQTKRMQRRSSSASMAHSPNRRGRPAGGLERTPSNGSMTERTFRRSPSPGRPVSQGHPDYTPPVPNIPADIPEPPPFSTKAQRRAASLEPRGSQRVYSPATRTFVEVSVPAPPQPKPQAQARPPAPAQPKTQAQAAAASVAPPRPAAGAQTAALRSFSPPYELQRSDSRNSINFSYPRPQSPQARSPTSPIATSSPIQEPRPAQPVQNGITPAQAEAVKYEVAHAAQAPVKKKKKKVAPQSAEGSHLSTGTMASKPVTTPLEPGPEIPPEPPASAQPVKKKKKKKVMVTGEKSHFPSDSGQSDSDSAMEQTRKAQRASGMLLKQPSLVREDWEGEQEQERIEAQAREEQGLSPVSSPNAVQGKKTTAANMSRKIEEPQAQAQKPAATPVYHAVSTDEPASPTIASPPPEQLLGVGQPQRTPSISPSRARFSDRLASDLGVGKKHEPLPRSYSPVKSALKHHDASPSDPNALRVRESSATPSDASDLSADGTMRRKKSARVSFQPEPEIVGTGADVEEVEEPAPASPENKDAGKRGFFGFGRARPTLTTIPSEEDMDEYKPRPELPSFGSIRAKGRRTDSSDSVELAQKSTKAPSTSSDSSTSNGLQQPQGVSSDHALGGDFAQQVANQAARFSTYAPALGQPARDPNLPLPPEVTSVEGSGYVSDPSSSSEDEDDEDMMAPTPIAAPIQVTPTPAPAQEPAIAAVPVESKTPVVPKAEPQEVPAVAVHPPTPNPEDDKSTDQWEVEVPGGFPGAFDEVETTPHAITPIVKEQSSVPAKAPESVPAASPVLKIQTPEESEEEDTDNASIYSDAAEDLSDLEGDGFGSINAIVESPIVTTSKMVDLNTPPQSPLAAVSNRPAEPNRTASWDEAQEKWKGIAQQTREQTQQPVRKASGGGLEDSKWAQPQAPATLAPAPQMKPKKKKKTGAALAASIAPASTLRQPQDSPPKSKNQTSAYPTINNGGGSFRQSMRSQPAPQGPAPGGIRTSLRAPPPPAEGAMRSSMRAPAGPRPKSPVQAIAPPASPPRAALQKKHIPAATKAAAPRSVPKKSGNDSDSDSSFQRTRRRKPDAGAYTMRSSMRAGPQSVPTQPAGRGAVRSLSPPQRRPFSPTGEPKAFRSSMRTSLDDAGPTLRGQPETKRSSSLFGRRKNKSPSPAPARSSPFGAVKSRIAEDSDDDDRPRQKTFRSRFQDSSDEDEPLPVPPITRPARRTKDEDSTDLDDSSDEERKAPKAKPQAPKINTAVAQAPQSGAALSPTSPTKKKGLFSRLRGKKDKDDPAVASPVNGVPAAQNPVVNGNAGKEEKEDDMGNMGFASTEERDEMIRQTMAKLEAAKSNDSEANSSSTAGNLQRRGMGQRIMSDSWPLPDKPAPDLDTRPSTSSGVPAKTNGTAIRPALGERIPTSETTDSSGVVYGRSGKKKRFPMLRKALGLKD
jgi:serine/arginine repetitive matrix protein 2